jgi:hypothetical protein
VKPLTGCIRATPTARSDQVVTIPLNAIKGLADLLSKAPARVRAVDYMPDFRGCMLAGTVISSDQGWAFLARKRSRGPVLVVQFGAMIVVAPERDFTDRFFQGRPRLVVRDETALKGRPWRQTDIEIRRAMVRDRASRRRAEGR